MSTYKKEKKVFFTRVVQVIKYKWDSDLGDKDSSKSGRKSDTWTSREIQNGSSFSPEEKREGGQCSRDFPGILASPSKTSESEKLFSLEICAPKFFLAVLYYEN